ncbi:MAG TPA: hypothetical protein PLB96_01720 [Syntrophales bacterium]|nr:hypothetical protein [Syntrophales bacterium]
MYYFFILPALVLYPLLTYKITQEVWKRTKSKRLTIITLAIFLLIPTWDVVIGYGIFLYKWATWSGTKIYRTVEAEGMYYEGAYSIISEGSVVSAEYYFRKGYNVLETLVDKDWSGPRFGKEETRREKIKPILYRCTYDKSKKNKHDAKRVKCQPVEKPICRFKVTKHEERILNLTFFTNTVFDRQERAFLGEARAISIKYLGFGPVPFFSWLEWPDRSYYENWWISSNPKVAEFEFEVVKPLAGC